MAFENPGMERPGFPNPEWPVNLFAQEMAVDSEQAMGVASAGDVQFALYSSNIVLLSRDPESCTTTQGSS